MSTFEGAWLLLTEERLGSVIDKQKGMRMISVRL